MKRVGISLVLGIAAGSVPASSHASAVVSGSVRSLALEIGITPCALVMADLAGATPSILHSLIEATELRAVLEQRRGAVVQSANAVAEAAELCAAAPDDAAAQQVFRETVALEGQARAQMAAAQADLRNAVLAHASAPQVATLDRVRSAAPYAAPPEFGIAARSNEEWRAIEAALVAEERAAALQVPLDDHHATLVASVRSHPQVVLARQHLMLHLEAVEALFAQFQ